MNHMEFTEERIRLVLGSLEHIIEQQKKLISLTEEYVAKLLACKTELLKLLEDLAKPDVDVMSLQSRFMEVMRQLDELMQE